ncbi:MAG: F0F1 ATP synthase subunit gamma [Alphaproteobacteria bacterium]|nr:F0F1 ATP synthase subunit gamma [Alphaproteobacteria bacterium]
MPSLRDYRDQIKSVKSTRKITSAMKMVAASKLRKAQEGAEAAQPYAELMAKMLKRVSANIMIDSESPRLLIGTGSNQKQLLIVVTADRGLCGGFNANLVKAARQKIKTLKAEGRDISIVCVGRKGYDLLKREFSDKILHNFKDMFGKQGVEYKSAQDIRNFVLEHFEAGTFDVCTVLYNEFVSVLTQKPTAMQLIPFDIISMKEDEEQQEETVLQYEFEPSEQEILEKLLPRNIGIQIFRAMLDSAAGEQAARMTAMDNATRNAGEMIKDLTLEYNRARQAYITKELIEIISGAEAL